MTKLYKGGQIYVDPWFWQLQLTVLGSFPSGSVVRQHPGQGHGWSELALHGGEQAELPVLTHFLLLPLLFHL